MVWSKKQTILVKKFDGVWLDCPVKGLIFDRAIAEVGLDSRLCNGNARKEAG